MSEANGGALEVPTRQGLAPLDSGQTAVRIYRTADHADAGYFTWLTLTDSFLVCLP